MLFHRQPIPHTTIQLPGIGLKITNRINEHLFDLYSQETTSEAKGAARSRFSGSKPVLILAPDSKVYQELVKSRALVVLGSVPGIGCAHILYLFIFLPDCLAQAHDRQKTCRCWMSLNKGSEIRRILRHVNSKANSQPEIHGPF